MERYPCLVDGGIKRVINGGMVFSPDGNPIIGPVRGLNNYFLACGVMAGFSQGGGVGLAVAQWIIEGEPGMDVFAMDIARYGEHADAALRAGEDDGELPPPLHHHLPERGTARRAAAQDDAGLRRLRAGGRCLRRALWLGVSVVVRRRRQGRDRSADLPPLRSLRAHRRGSKSGARGGRPVRILLLRQVRRDGLRRYGVPRPADQQQAAAGRRQDRAGAAADAEGPGVRRPDGDASRR